MNLGRALTRALRQMYEQSWRLALVNLALSIVIVAVLYAVSYATTLLVLFVLVGPFAAALMHCAVKLQQTEELSLRDALEGLRLHWRRGLALGTLVAAATLVAVTAISFYSSRGSHAWPIALFAVYVAMMFGVWQLHVWPLAVARRGERIGEVLREAGRSLFSRPFTSIGLALVLLLVNAVGAIGVLPVLTLTIAYSALAAAHFVLPPPTEEALR
jgi:hypothetical protein